MNAGGSGGAGRGAGNSGGGSGGGAAGTGGIAGAVAGGTGTAGGGAGGGAGTASGTGGSAGNGGHPAGGIGGGAAGAGGTAGTAGGGAGGGGVGGATDAGVGGGASGAAGAVPDAATDGGDAGSGANPSSCWIGDFDGDGTPDCAMAGPGALDVSFFRGLGGGVYDVTPVVTPSILLSGFVLLTAPLDMTGEGRDDLEFEEPAGRAVNLLLLTGEADGTFQRVPAVSPPGRPAASGPIGIPGQFDSSGKNEVFFPTFSIAGSLGETPEVTFVVFYVDDTNTAKVTLNYFAVTGGSDLPDYIVASGAVGDVNGNQLLDAITIVHFASSAMGAGPPYQIVEVALGNGDRTFQQARYVLGTEGATSVQVDDVNQDGNLDLLVDLPAGPTTFYGDGNGGFSTSAP